MKKKCKQFYIQGVFHKLTVRLVSRKWLARQEDEPNIMGNYTHEDGLIHIVEELTYPVRLHTLAHELGHHIVECFALKFRAPEDEEKFCDDYGAYWLRCLSDRERIEKYLKPSI